ncbi:MAG TPA: metallopeptidase TldD-related protein [Vitreimonas sp.]|uniref:TldD/PmbA family protein n=1 Tax=Vitreimonas sp. TaxID=3069702 RepID=UPI002D42DCF2|nr:metallopeptidase TldD-related protein [Vitreimonas sp.]HYD87248.1 metallopeptidase TldD-related protein [Vitreimonas sp.]
MAFDTDSTAALAALIDYANAAGADASEASLAARESISAEVRMGELEGMEREEGRSVALRAFIGKRQAAASSTDLSTKGLKALAERVVAMAKAAPEDKFAGLLDQRYLARGPAPELEQSDTARPTPEQLLELAKRCEAASLAIPGIANSGGGGASFENAIFVHATSTGFEGAESATSYSLGTQPVAEKGDEMERDYEWRTKRFFADLPSAEEIGRIAGERTTRRLGARKVASQKAPVIFENRLAGRIISPFFSAISGASVARGVSFLKDKLGQRIFAEGFRIHEDPFVKRGAGSRWFDGEGGAVAPATLIDDGVLTMWLLNSSAARQLGLEPNGHATAGHGGPPGIGTANLFVKPGAEDLPGLMKSASKGLLVTDMFSPSLNMNTGDWSVGVAGYWFENGEIVHPVSEVTVAGSLLDIFARLRCGSDVDNRGALEIPSLIVDDLAVGGV